MPKEECAFCPSQATATGEHLWSDWINGILSDRIYQFKKVDAKKLTVKNWEASELNLKSRVVCGQCNSGWMSQLDGSEAKPILRHLIVDLGPRQLPIRWLISLALFGFKTAVISDHVSIRNAPFFSREQRHNFARTLQIPGGVYMWFGALKHDRKGVFTSRHVIPAIPSQDHFRLYSFTYAAGHFVLQVVGAKWTSDDAKRIPFPYIEQSPKDAVMMTAFWPIWIPQINISWPPSQYLTDDSVDALANRWGTLNLVR